MNQQEFIEYVLYIANRCPRIGITKLYKFFWFANIMYAERYWGIMVKDVFIKWKHWPIPEDGKNYIDLVRDMENSEDENIKIITEIYPPYQSIQIEAKRKEDPDYFTQADREILDEIIQKYGKYTATEISDISHDKAWKEARMFGKVDITKDMKVKKHIPVVKELYNDIIFLKQMRTYA